MEIEIDLHTWSIWNTMYIRKTLHTLAIIRIFTQKLPVMRDTLMKELAPELYYNEFFIHKKITVWKYNKGWIPSRCVTSCRKGGLMCHHPWTPSTFLLLYCLMLAWRIMLKNHGKARMFITAPGSKHAVGRCWEYPLHSWCQNTSALAQPPSWTWTLQW